ncbi:hypothetical protein [Tropicimonas sp. IMCC6043]|uniref:hypothetical protein n=1 Tax=Tropicimonas sp. IMCC6043 TaxID=2510645 RepID=UPI0013EB3156|nr:hypothetical protein [Tropicimonas sp. IMCC6043]
MLAGSDKIAHAATVLVSLRTLAMPTGVLAGVGAAATGYLSLRELIRQLPKEARPIAARVETRLKEALESPELSDDVRALLPQMIEASMPAPREIIDRGMEAGDLVEAMLGRLTDREHRLPANRDAFRDIVTPILDELLDDPALSGQLAPAFQRAVLAQLRETAESLAHLSETYGSLAKSLDELRELRRSDLVTLALVFEIERPHALKDAELRELLTLKAEEHRRLKAEIDALPGQYQRLSNIKAAAQAAAEALRFDEVEELLSAAHAIELDEAARSAELRADNALLRGRVEQAFELLSAAADSFRPVDPLEPARRRLLYVKVLYDHGLRYGGPGMAFAARMARWVIAACPEAEERELCAHAQNALAISLQDLGNRTGGEDSARLLDEAVAAIRAALRVHTEASHPVLSATTKNNLANALRQQGSRTGGETGLRLLAEAIATYRAALRVRTEAAHSVDWAMTQNNLANALAAHGNRIRGEDGAQWIAEAVATYRAALRVFTEAAHPVSWAMTQENMAIAEKALAENETVAAPRAHLQAALGHVEAALRVYDPAHMAYRHEKATRLRQEIIAALAARDGDE